MLQLLLEEKVGMVPTLVLKTSSRKAGFESYFFREGDTHAMPIPKEEEKALRHYTPEGVLKEFGSKHDRKVIAAMMDWLSMNSLCAWRFKNNKQHVSTNAVSRTVMRDMNKYDCVVLDRDRLDHAMEVLIGKTK